MIGYISGAVLAIEGDSVIVNAGGVGYELLCSKNTSSDLLEDEIASLFVHTHVREDCIQLFGFSTKNEKQLFLSLIKVNGIGPKMATTILSGARLEEIIGWINAADAKSLTSLPKVGKKTAEQMILALKGQLSSADQESGPTRGGHQDQVKSALLNLGYRMADIEKVSDEIENSKSVQEGIREALQALSRRLLGEL